MPALLRDAASAEALALGSVAAIRKALSPRDGDEDEVLRDGDEVEIWRPLKRELHPYQFAKSYSSYEIIAKLRHI